MPKLILFMLLIILSNMAIRTFHLIVLFELNCLQSFFGQFSCFILFLCFIISHRFLVQAGHQLPKRLTVLDIQTREKVSSSSVLDLGIRRFQTGRFIRKQTIDRF